MESPLSSETVAEIRQIARKISVAHDLDDDIQAELQSHMEDKALAYLSGEQKLSEADVLLLTREHFGNPAIIKVMM